MSPRIASKFVSVVLLFILGVSHLLLEFIPPECSVAPINKEKVALIFGDEDVGQKETALVKQRGNIARVYGDVHDRIG